MPRFPWIQKKPHWSHTPAWKGECPRCGPFNQDDTPCPFCDEATLVVHHTYVQHPLELKNFFLEGFRFSRMIGQQELRCSANDGYYGRTITCPLCDEETVGSSRLSGIYLVPRLILYVPFVLVLSLGTVRATCGIGLLFWPCVSSFFGCIYMLLFNHPFFPWPLRYLFNKDAEFSFYDTNDAPGLLAGSAGHQSR
jgi:hypothetical protein